jgi:hypothetical protein
MAAQRHEFIEIRNKHDQYALRESIGLLKPFRGANTVHTNLPVENNR